ncbi:SanA/YdcF family protein [Anaerovorax odorimutans]|uniref:SanA/YdcF family protein n=1 Tax=Anaerovorax odorimutans TaxID=109327 RepID=UPI0003F5D7BE|nr:ElyC/SanA/YdcF family protein [Anaerovorax odorimutans]
MILNKRKKYVLILVIVLILIILVPCIINKYMILKSQSYIINGESFEQISNKTKALNADCILVLGAGLKSDGTPNHMLEDRLDVGIKLYQSGGAPKILLSGDNGQDRYDEVNAMKAYVVNKGIPLEDIFLDHAGFSTYESMYRAGAIFNVKNVIVVTQKYHQYRAIYIGKRLNLNVYGVVSEPRQYVGQDYRDFREFLARNKDFVKSIYKPKPTYLGDIIPISGNGIASHD